MESVVRLLNNSLEVDTDRMRSFISAWAGLEIFINKTFSGYRSRFFEALEQNVGSYAVEFLMERNLEVMKTRSNLLERFAIVSHYLAQDSSKVDIQIFKDIKGLRDKLFHGKEIPESSLPVLETQQLLQTYLAKHIRVERR